VARRLGEVELVSADSMQVYRGMDVGTAKATVAERAEVPHHLLDVADPHEDFSVARFQALAAEAIAGIEERGRRALVVGGTGLYVQAVVDGLSLPGEWPELRQELADQPVEELYRRLADLDPLAASRIEPGNARRLVRALEVTVGSGKPFSSFGPGLSRYPRNARFRLAGVWLPRPVLAARIEARYRAQLDDGFLDEVRGLSAAGMSRTARQALGYRELLDHLAGHGSLEEAVDAAVRRTREFARRQRAWFRRDPRITWLGAAANPVELLPALLGDWSLP
jgi:tRNA dimethylallyltransferase